MNSKKQSKAHLFDTFHQTHSAQSSQAFEQTPSLLASTYEIIDIVDVNKT